MSPYSAEYYAIFVAGLSNKLSYSYAKIGRSIFAAIAGRISP
jgi:hypothetical protein